MNERSEKGKLIVITGPSGVGKSSIVSEVRRRTDAEFSVSATTRKPRPGERDEVDYYFIDRDTFGRMVDAGEMLEWAEVFGQCYGTPAAPVLEAVSGGKKVILEIDVQGGVQVARKVPDATFILIAPPNMTELKDRLTGRGSETQQQIDKRLGEAENELRIARESGVYTHEIINDDLETAIQKVVVAINQE
ncbi:MAG: guanylate kinase [Phycisphaerae bacterium]|nr:guanylate kinase [Phycisphaerae bacterium]